MLTEIQCRTALCPDGKKRHRLTDERGLYLEISPAGSKRWFLKIYRPGGSESRLALGSYPAVSLKAARLRRDAAKAQVADGIDPIQARKAAKARSNDGDSVRTVALEWLAKQRETWSEVHYDTMSRLLDRDLFPVLGERPIREIEPPELLSVIRRIEARGAVETAHRALTIAGQIWRYGIATGRTQRDIAADLKGALTPVRRKHLGAVTDPARLGGLIRSLRAYKGGPVVRAALQLAPLLFQRPGEMRGARWAEIDLDSGMWTIPAARMKRSKAEKESGQPHLVPLPRQAVEILRDLEPYTRSTGLVFPGERQRDRPMSENTIRVALLALGISSEEQTGHGFRATARTLLAERLEFDERLIEAQLAHAVRDTNGRAYNRTTFIEQRRNMMQCWADYLDQLAAVAAAA